MPKFLLTRWHGFHMMLAFAVMAVLTIILFFFDWKLGIVALLFIGLVGYYTWFAERAFRRDLNDYVLTLSHRVKRASHEVLHELPLGIILYNEDKEIEWHNPYISRMTERDSVVGESIVEIFPILSGKKEKEDKVELKFGARDYTVLMKAEERLLYIYETTELVNLQRKYEEEKIALGIIALDNLDEVSQSMDDQQRSIMLAKVTGEITEWANKHGMYLRRTASDRFMTIMDNKALRSLEQSKFDILDEVRDLTVEHKIPLTLSIGVAAGIDKLTEMGALAQSSLDIALGRGGDQAAVRTGQRLNFFGGRSNAVEKRTRVRARVISHALRDLMRDSDRVMIMGHKNPDLDSIGAAIGVLKMVHLMNKDGYIVMESVSPSIERLMEEIDEHEHLRKCFISPDQAAQLMQGRSLAVIVDTHKASMLFEPKLLTHAHRKVVIDHHRRGEEFINDAMLVYMEPYASSTCELVTELLQYFSDRITMEVLEATSLLAGITVDTKNFSLQTGSRTFEAASFLRRHGADSALVQRLLKEELGQYLKKAEVMRNTEIVHEHIAIAVTEPNIKYSQLLIAQVADTLLNMTEVYASFVIAELPDGRVGISARSLGDINVQVIMEKMGGGGHLTKAATQWGGTLAEARAMLKQILEEMNAEGELFE